MAVYTSSHVSNVSPVIQIQEQTIVGMGRIGVHYTQSNQTVYEITDHLGNVRATVSSVKTNGIPEVLSYTDFYPHGGILPGRNYVSSNAYRYDYQGQEKDPETNWSNFELRMYDANLARWMSPDPYGEFHSPYLAMGNNPVITIDPDGGKTVAMAPEPPPEPEYDGRQDDWLIERRDAIADGGGYGNRENKFYFEDGVPVNNGHIGSKKFADYEAKYELFEVSRIRQSREAHNKNRIRTSTLKNVFTKIIIRASNLFTKIDYVFADAQSNKGNGYDINAAVNTLNENAAAYSQHACARYIRYALEAGFGLQKDALRGKTPLPARQYGPFLQGKGFSTVPNAGYSPKMGDIRVFQPYPGGSQYGHIDMYNGTQWISDFKEKNEFPGSGYKNSVYEIFRWVTHP
jgi:RHS repeat-associated protein